MAPMVTRYSLKITLTEPLLASSPADPDVYKKFIQGKIDAENEKKGDEVETLPAGEQEKTGWSVFHEDENGLFMFDYQVRGFIKSAAEAVTGNKGTEGLVAYKSKIDKWLFVTPRRIYYRAPEGAHITEKHGVLERPLRAMTMQGPRVSLKRSDLIKPGSYIEATINVLPLGDSSFMKERLEDWFWYGQWQGLGEWRSGSYGRFQFELKKLG